MDERSEIKVTKSIQQAGMFATTSNVTNKKKAQRLSSSPCNAWGLNVDEASQIVTSHKTKSLLMGTKTALVLQNKLSESIRKDVSLFKVQLSGVRKYSQQGRQLTATRRMHKFRMPDPDLQPIMTTYCTLFIRTVHKILIQSWNSLDRLQILTTCLIKLLEEWMKKELQSNLHNKSAKGIIIMSHAYHIHWEQT